MSMVKKLKRHDIGDALTVTIYYNEADLDITGTINPATGVVFTMSSADTPTVPTVNRQVAEVVDYAIPQAVLVRYQWASGDLDTPGVYLGEFEFDLSGNPLTAPADGYITLIVEDDLA